VSVVIRKILQTRAPAANVLVRLIAGGVFLAEGLQKFLFPTRLGIGRFVKIGIPAAHVMAPLDGTLEIICGVLFLIGLLTRLAAVPMIVNMIVAIISTKIPILLGHGFWRFSLPKMNAYGFWEMAHEARADWSMLLASIFLLIVGAGTWSLDAKIAK